MFSKLKAMFVWGWRCRDVRPYDYQWLYMIIGHYLEDQYQHIYNHGCHVGDKHIARDIKLMADSAFRLYEGGYDEKHPEYEEYMEQVLNYWQFDKNEDIGRGPRPDESLCLRIHNYGEKARAKDNRRLGKLFLPKYHKNHKTGYIFYKVRLERYWD